MTRELNRTNCVHLLLHSFQSNQVVKGLVFMPGATDELYMFRRAKAQLTNPNPTLLDAVTALTNQTLIRATFHPPLLLLHTGEDPAEPTFMVQNQPALERLKNLQFVDHAIFEDDDWDTIQPVLKKTLKADVSPWTRSYNSWHFYRHNFAAWSLNGYEALEAVTLSGKTRCTVSKNPFLSLRRLSLHFEPDPRIGAVPTLESFPR